MLKKVQVVMLPTEKANNCLYLQNGSKLHYHKGYLTQDYLRNMLNAKAFHLYFLSDEEIKEGDWYLTQTPILQSPVQCTGFERNGFTILHSSGGSDKSICKKIIATTDSSLPIYNIGDGIAAFVALPQPSQSFLKVFVREYNKENVIKEVMVEYEENILYPMVENNNIKLKVNPEDNTITIKRVKDSWNREEVESLIIKALDDIHGSLSSKSDIDELNDWIEQNI